jgi:oxygen-independent coproporphyrinogen III oxidase
MPTGLYVHLPFCRVHCTYCPFAITTDLAWQDRYVDALLREVRAALPQTADSLYLGGGTPSRTSLPHLETLFAALRQQFDLEPEAEVSLEANPEDVTAEALAAWRDLGVTRLSIGVQSFHDAELAAIGRAHDRSRALEAVATATGSGIRTNLDLILGLPNQTADSFRETLAIAARLGVGHLSLYMLDLEERTPLQVQVERGRVELPDDDRVAELYLEAIDVLSAAGLQQYEISNFAREGEECRHNLRYWTRREYLGFGIAAHSFAGRRRFANTRDIRVYIESSPESVDFTEELGETEVRREEIFLGLRQTSGMCYEDLVRLCGQEAMEWSERGVQDGWLIRRGDRVALTPSGFLRSNDYISQLF